MKTFSSSRAIAVALFTAPTAAAQSVPIFTAVRDFTISAAAADLSHVGDVLVSRNGDVLITQWAEKSLLVFSATGVRSTIGRSGEGPGEFRNLRLAGWMGDSIWVSDPALNRISIFSPTYKYVRSFSYPETITNPAAPREPVGTFEILSPGAMYADGSLRMVAAGHSKQAQPHWITPADSTTGIMVHTTAKGAFIARVATTYPVPPQCLAPVGRSVWHIPFCAVPITTDYAGTPDFVAVTVTSVKGPNSSYHVDVRDGQGVAHISRDYPVVPVPLPRAVRDSAAGEIRHASEKEFGAAAAIARIVWPVTYPPVRDIFVGRDGTLWIDERHKEAGHHWLVVDRSGNPLFTLTVPESVTLRAGDLQMAWGLETDADGLQGIVRYRVGGRGG